MPQERHVPTSLSHTFSTGSAKDPQRRTPRSLFDATKHTTQILHIRASPYRPHPGAFPLNLGVAREQLHVGAQVLLLSGTQVCMAGRSDAYRPKHHRNCITRSCCSSHTATRGEQADGGAGGRAECVDHLGAGTRVRSRFTHETNERACTLLRTSWEETVFSLTFTRRPCLWFTARSTPSPHHGARRGSVPALTLRSARPACSRALPWQISLHLSCEWP